MQTYNAAHRAARIDRLAAPVLRWRAYKIRFPLTVGGATRNEKRLAPPDGPFALDHLATIMAIHMGIVCTKCLTVHFIGTSPRIKLSGTDDSTYKLMCGSCLATTPFRKDEMRPVRASDDDFYRGFARDGNYELV